MTLTKIFKDWIDDSARASVAVDFQPTQGVSASFVPGNLNYGELAVEGVVVASFLHTDLNYSKDQFAVAIDKFMSGIRAGEELVLELDEFMLEVVEQDLITTSHVQMDEEITLFYNGENKTKALIVTMPGFEEQVETPYFDVAGMIMRHRMKKHLTGVRLGDVIEDEEEDYSGMGER